MFCNGSKHWMILYINKPLIWYNFNNLSVQKWRERNVSMLQCRGHKLKQGGKFEAIFNLHVFKHFFCIGLINSFQRCPFLSTYTIKHIWWTTCTLLIACSKPLSKCVCVRLRACASKCVRERKGGRLMMWCKRRAESFHEVFVIEGSTVFPHLLLCVEKDFHIEMLFRCCCRIVAVVVVLVLVLFPVVFWCPVRRESNIHFWTKEDENWSRTVLLFHWDI